MATTVTGILSYALYPALALSAGAAAALVRAPGAGLRSAIQHFTAGVVFAALATELLPDLMHRRMPLVTFAGFACGVAAMLGIKHLAERFGQKGISTTKSAVSLLFTMGVDIVLDGILIGLGFAAGQKQGVLLTVALSLEVLFLGLSCAVALASMGASRSRVATVALLFSGLLLAGAAAGALMLAAAFPVILDAVLAFGLAALLYLVTEELLVEAHETAETAIQTANFFIGFALLLLIEMTI